MNKRIKAEKKITALMVALMMTGVLGTGYVYASESESTSYTREAVGNLDGQTVVVEQQESKTSQEHRDDRGVLGGAFNVVGEVLAFPFQVMAEGLRFVF